MTRHVTFVLAIGGLVLLLAGCGGGSADAGVIGGGGGGGGGNLSAAYTPDNPNPGPGDATIGAGPVSGDAITLLVQVTDVSDVYGASFEVTFDGTLAEYLGWAPGQVLEAGGVPVNYTVSSPAPGRVVVGASRTGNVSGVNVSGTQTVIQLTLRVTRAGNTVLAVVNGDLFDSSPTPQSIPNVTWSGGTLQAM